MNSFFSIIIRGHKYTPRSPEATTKSQPSSRRSGRLGNAKSCRLHKPKKF